MNACECNLLLSSLDFSPFLRSNGNPDMINISVDLAYSLLFPDQKGQEWKKNEASSNRLYDHLHVFFKNQANYKSLSFFFPSQQDLQSLWKVLKAHSFERIASVDIIKPVLVQVSVNPFLFVSMHVLHVFCSDENCVPLSSGDTIYGRVMVDPVQNLGDSFICNIEKVFLCTGTDGYVPKYNPSNFEFGCLADTPSLLYRFKIIVRNKSTSIIMNMYHIITCASCGFKPKCSLLSL